MLEPAPRSGRLEHSACQAACGLPRNAGVLAEQRAQRKRDHDRADDLENKHCQPFLVCPPGALTARAGRKKAGRFVPVFSFNMLP